MRRDFKCNAVYYDIAGDKFVDPLGGIEDIKNKRLDTVTDAKEVFSHDVTVYGLTLPPATETANRLVEKGFAFDTTITNEDELVEGVCKQLR